jgi:hypothetical protein
MKMLKKKLLLLTVCSFLLLSGQAVCADLSVKNPALKLMSFYAGEIKDSRTINPYIVNIIAIHEMNRQRHINEVKHYILWYFSHLNYPDQAGLTGTIYDYEIDKTGKEISTNDYDSADGYAGTFLYLLNLYHRLTDNNKLIDKHWKKIEDIAYLIPHLQSEDGLSMARMKSENNVKYLMDNCEAFAGIKSFNALAARTGRAKAPFYLKIETNIKKGILETLYNSDMKNFFWAIDDKVKHNSDWSILYPDALAQIFPIYFGLLDEDRKKKRMLWQEFSKRYGDKIKTFPLEQRMIYELTKAKMVE